MAWRQIALQGARNDSNTSFTIPFVPRANTVKVVHNGFALHRVSSGASSGQYTLDGTAVVVGLAPSSGDTLIVQAQEL